MNPDLWPGDEVVTKRGPVHANVWVMVLEATPSLVVLITVRRGGDGSPAATVMIGDEPSSLDHAWAEVHQVRSFPALWALLRLRLRDALPDENS